MLLLRLLFHFSSLFVICSAQGAPWSDEDTAIIFKKVGKLLSNPVMVQGRYRELHPEAPSYPPQTTPNAQKVTLTVLICSN